MLVTRRRAGFQADTSYAVLTTRALRAPEGYEANHRPGVTGRGRPAPNKGIYVTVVDNEMKCKRSYKFSSILINSCLGIQLVAAATLTALGAGDGSRGLVTVFGAINTVIAGFLTYLKGSGLPNRLKYFQHEWGKVREYIEQRERDIGIDGSIDVVAEYNIVQQMYEDVQADIQANTPDRFVGTGGASNRHGVAPDPPLATRQARKISSTMSEPMNVMREKIGEVQHTVRRVEGDVEAFGAELLGNAQTLRSHVDDDIGSLRKAVQEKMKELAEFDRQLLHQGRRNINSSITAVEAEIGDRAKEAGDLEREIEADGRSVIARGERENQTRP